MRYKTLLIFTMLILALAGCNLNSSSEEDISPGSTLPNNSGSPVVSINSPQNGDEVVVNEEVLLSVSATDSVGITRIQLFADNRIVQTVSSESATGDTSRSALLAYTPRTEGTLNLRVIAYRGSVASEPREITLSVRRTQAQVTATSQPSTNVPVINPNDPTCRALVNTNLNLRRGPGTSYDIIRILGAGELLPVTGRVQDNSWLQLSSGTTLGWVSTSFVTTYGTLCANIGVVVTPTAIRISTSTPLPATNTPIPPAPTNTPVPAQPNLNVPSIGGSTTLTIPTGQTSVSQQYGVTIRNTGGTITGQFSNLVRVSPGNAEYDLGVVGGLTAGSSINLTINLTFDAPGIYTIRVIVDSENQISEDVETDNIAIIEVTVN
ncbi:MAG: CARDB domain-containing protein [Aggregatilineales bacterium]